MQFSQRSVPKGFVEGPFSFSPHTDSQSDFQKMAEAGSLKERSSAFYVPLQTFVIAS